MARLYHVLTNLLAAVHCSLAHAPESEDQMDVEPPFEFTGQDYWTHLMRHTCDFPPAEHHFRADLHCYRKFVNLSPVKTEVLNRDPLLIHYHHLISRENAREFVQSAEKKEIAEQTVVKDNDSKLSESHSSRRANGTWMQHTGEPITSKVFQQVGEKIGINFRAAEDWQILMYGPGGHYAPHYDFLEQNDPSKFDYWMENFGNRIATFFLVLETATRGGGTTFPDLYLTVTPEPGDAILWFNMEPDGSLAAKSLHGGCPIMEGRKVAATIWVRVRGQELHIPCPSAPEQPFPMEHFT